MTHMEASGSLMNPQMYISTPQPMNITSDSPMVTYSTTITMVPTSNSQPLLVMKNGGTLTTQATPGVMMLMETNGFLTVMVISKTIRFQKTSKLNNQRWKNEHDLNRVKK